MSAHTSIRDEVISYFQTVEADNLEYAIMRGWDGEKITGSDIDILVSPESINSMVAKGKSQGYSHESRGALRFDLFSSESYLDKTVDNELIRLHLTDKLLFGKPGRLVRIPVEDEVLSNTEYDEVLEATTIRSPYDALIDLFRLTVDKPHRIGEDRLGFEPLEDGSTDNAALNAVIPDVLSILKARQRDVITKTETQQRVLRRLQGLEKSEYWLRRYQTIPCRYVEYWKHKLGKILPERIKKTLKGITK